MSSATPAGAVSIQAILDLTQVHAQLANLRSGGWTMPIQANFVGPTGATAATGGVAGPATFGNPSGRPFNLAAMLAATGGNNPNAAVGPSGGQQFAQAAQQLTQAAQALQQAAQSFGQGGSQGGSGASSGAASARGTGQFAGLSTRGLARYVGAGFLAREALNLFGADNEYTNSSMLANNQPRQQYEAENRLIRGVSSIPIVGQLASFLVDPRGQEAFSNQLSVSSADGSEGLAEMRAGFQSRTLGIRRDAAIAGMYGASQQKAQVEAEYKSKDAELVKIRASKEVQSKVDEEIATRKAKTNLLYNGLISEAIYTGGADPTLWQIKRAEDLEKKRQENLTEIDRSRESLLDNSIQGQRAAIDAERTAKLARINTGTDRQVDDWNTEAVIARAMAPSATGPSFGLSRSAQRAKAARDEEWVQIETGGKLRKDFPAGREGDSAYEAQITNSARAFSDLADSRLWAEDQARYQRESREMFRMESSTRHLNIISGHDSSTMNERPGTRRALAELQDIVDSTDLRRRSLIDEFGDEAGPLIRQNRLQGRAQISAFRQQFQDSIHGVSVNPFTQSLNGVGSVDEDNIRRRIDKAFNQVDSVKGANDGGESGKAVAMNTKEIVTALRETNTKLDQLNSKFDVA